MAEQTLHRMRKQGADAPILIPYPPTPTQGADSVPPSGPGAATTAAARLAALARPAPHSATGSRREPQQLYGLLQSPRLRHHAEVSHTARLHKLQHAHAIGVPLPLREPHARQRFHQPAQAKVQQKLTLRGESRNRQPAPTSTTWNRDGDPMSSQSCLTCTARRAPKAGWAAARCGARARSG